MMLQFFREDILKSGINRSLDDTGEPLISSGLVGAYGKNDWERIRECLKKWEGEGILRILDDPESLSPTKPCVEMLKYIHQRSSIPGFLNWEE